MTRRQLATSLLAAVPAAAAAQSTTGAAQPADDLAIQRANIKRNIDTLDKFKVPVATEPSIVFKP